MADKEKSDLFGLAAYGEALNTLAKGAVDGAGAFLSKICLPAAEEFGLLLRDKVSGWRAKNAVNISLQAEKILLGMNKKDVHAHPRLVMKILSEGSWSEDDQVSSMWAGLLASSCTVDGKDESNVIFINIVSQITALQARVIDYACKNAVKDISEHGLIYAEHLIINLNDIFDITQSQDLQRIDRELDHLRSMELIGGSLGTGGIDLRSENVDITPTALTLQLYSRCNGYSGSPENFYKITRKKLNKAN